MTIGSTRIQICQMTISNINRVFEKEVEQSISKLNMHGKYTIVAAISGGQDSMAMLTSLYKLSKNNGFAIHGAHLNHQLRGFNSVKDAEFVTNTFESFNIPYTLESIDVSKYKTTKKLSMEEAAREIRYDFLSKVALKAKTNLIALGHTSDDQIETILMNIIRGCGLNGLKGMEHLTTKTINSRTYSLFRPLLNIKRTQTLTYCKSNNIAIQIDESNLNTDLTRNRIRLKLLPYLQTFNPSISNSLLRLSTIASRVIEDQQIKVANFFDEIVSNQNNYFSINLQKFNIHNTHIKTQLLMETIKSIRGDLRGIEHKDYHNLISMINLGNVGSKKKFLGFYCLISYDEAFIYRKERDINNLPILNGTHQLKIPGTTQLGEWQIQSKLINLNNEPYSESIKDLNKSPYSEAFDISLLETDLHIRTRQPGDKFVPLGMCNAKKLKDFMVDSKIPQHHRDRIPLVCSNTGIIWVVGWRISNLAKLNNTDTKAIQINFQIK